MNRIQTVLAEAEAAATNLSLTSSTHSPALTMDGLVDPTGIDAWITVTRHGFTIAGGDQLLKSLTAELDLAAVRPCLVLKTPTPTYFRTYDGVLATNGAPWDRVVAHVRESFPAERPYRSADIPLRLTGEIVAGAGLTLPAGAVLGLSLSTTAWKIWEAFYRRLRLQGLHQAVIRVRLSPDRRTNGLHEWGVPRFEHISTGEIGREAGQG